MGRAQGLGEELDDSRTASEDEIGQTGPCGATMVVASANKRAWSEMLSSSGWTTSKPSADRTSATSASLATRRIVVPARLMYRCLPPRCVEPGIRRERSQATSDSGMIALKSSRSAALRTTEEQATRSPLPTYRISMGEYRAARMSRASSTNRARSLDTNRTGGVDFGVQHVQRHPAGGRRPSNGSSSSRPPSHRAD